MNYHGKNQLVIVDTLLQNLYNDGYRYIVYDMLEGGTGNDEDPTYEGYLVCKELPPIDEEDNKRIVPADSSRFIDPVLTDMGILNGNKKDDFLVLKNKNNALNIAYSLGIVDWDTMLRDTPMISRTTGSRYYYANKHDEKGVYVYPYGRTFWSNNESDDNLSKIDKWDIYLPSIVENEIYEYKKN